jgi:hypothetical protein
VRPKVLLDLPALVLGEGIERVGLLQVVKALAPWLVS